MNIMNRLTFRQLIKNKKRTIVTIIGVIISVAMITAVTSIGDSFLDLLRREHILREGEWHVIYRDINEEQLEAIKKQENLVDIVLSDNLGFAKLDGSKNASRPYLFVKSYSSEGFKHFPITLTSGRLPSAPGEVIISDEIALTAGIDLAVGQTITLDIGTRYVDPVYEFETAPGPDIPLRRDENGSIESIIDSREMSFTIVGTMARPGWEPAWGPAYTIVSYLDPASLASGSNADAAVILNKIRRGIFDDALNFSAEHGIAKTDFNSELLRYYGVTKNENLQSTINNLTAIILCITVIASIALIYNAFAISVAERTRYLGMLASVGATRRQKRNSVLFEAFLIAIVSIPPGLLAGFAGMALTFRIINKTIQGALGLSEVLLLRVRGLSIFAAVILSMLTIFISSWNPARKASKVSAIDAIRQTDDVRLSKRTVRTSFIVRKFFGLEGEIGLKNLKRNRRRYLITVLSIVMSLVLFLSVSYFTIALKKAVVLAQDGVDFDIQIISELDADATLLMASDLAKRDEVTNLAVIRHNSANAYLPPDLLASELQDMVKEEPDVLQDGFYHYYVEIYALDQDSLSAYLADIGPSLDLLDDKGKPQAIMIESAKYENAAGNMIIETKASQLQRGDVIDLKSFVYEEGETAEDLASIEIAAITDKLPTGVSQPGLGGLSIIVSDETFDAISSIDDWVDYRSIYLRSDDPMKTQYALDEQANSSLDVYNVFQSRQREEQMLLLMSVFTYGFIVLMTAICIANIFNTISTGVALRKREFAMLKSIGMTPKAFNRMIRYESLFYGLKSLVIGLPLSVLLMLLIHRAVASSLSFRFELPWLSIIFAIVAVFIIVGSAMIYSSTKIKRENIIDAIKQENI